MAFKQSSNKHYRNPLLLSNYRKPLIDFSAKDYKSYDKAFHKNTEYLNTDNLALQLEQNPKEKNESQSY